MASVKKRGGAWLVLLLVSFVGFWLAGIVVVQCALLSLIPHSTSQGDLNAILLPGAGSLALLLIPWGLWAFRPTSAKRLGATLTTALAVAWGGYSSWTLINAIRAVAVASGTHDSMLDSLWAARAQLGPLRRPVDRELLANAATPWLARQIVLDRNPARARSSNDLKPRP